MLSEIGSWRGHENSGRFVGSRPREEEADKPIFGLGGHSSKHYDVRVDQAGVATSHRRARYGQVRQIVAHAGRRWVSATGRRSAIKGRLPAHFRLIINRLEMATRVQALHCYRILELAPASIGKDLDGGSKGRPRTYRRPEREDHDTKLWQTTKEVFPGH